MDWVTWIRRAIGVALIIPILVIVFNPLREVLNRATANNLVVILIVTVYTALCIWGLLAWSKRAKK